MPIFEYQCSDCQREFEAYVTGGRTPACPACQGAKLVKRLSSPGMVGVSGGRSTAAAAPMPGGCGAGGAGCACRPTH